MKIPKRFCFDPEKLRLWIHTKPNISRKALYEILVTLTVYTAYHDDQPGEYMIYFPIKKSTTEKVGILYEDFFNSHIEDYSAFDVIFIRIEDNQKPRELHCQIKQFGRGKQKNGNTEDLIHFLSKYEDMDAKNVRLIISLDGCGTIEPQKIFDWLNSRAYPFSEVVLVHMASENDNFDFYQLKPNNGVTFSKKTSAELK